MDLPRIFDAFASEIKSGHMAGPFPLGFIEGAKVCGLIPIEKPGGARRQVGNLSAPQGSSFNEGIPETALKEWRVEQTTSKQIAYMIARAGQGAIIS